MPPRLNVAKAALYAQVDPAFTDLLKQIWKARWAALNNDIRVQPPAYRKMKAKQNAPMMSRLKGLCTGQALLDREITRLRGLPYERFYTRLYGGQAWMVGLTRPVVMSDDSRRYQAPRYFVYIPQDVLAKGTGAAFHFVPEGNELITARHPHHKVKTHCWGSTGHLEAYDYSSVTDPLDYRPDTCWGSFGEIATLCIRAGDMVDLFRNIAIYLTRVDQRSLLVHPFSACHFLVDVGPVDQPNGRTRR